MICNINVIVFDMIHSLDHFINKVYTHSFGTSDKGNKLGPLS
jgi:hypothetical protein